MSRNSTQHVFLNSRGKLAAAFLLLIAVSAGATAAKPAPEQQTVLVYDAAKVPPQVLQRAKDDTARILGEARIQIRWLNCTPEPGECPQSFDRTMLVLHIAANRRGLEDGESTGIALLAPEGGVHFYVFYNAIELIAKGDVKPAVILAHAIAHEIGHLLLSLHGHTPTGMMQGRWGAGELQKANMGFLVFSPEQAAKMREEIRRRAGDNLAAKSF